MAFGANLENFQPFLRIFLRSPPSRCPYAFAPLRKRSRMDFNAQYARGFDRDIEDPRLTWVPHGLSALVIEMATRSVPQSMAEGSSSSNHCEHFPSSVSRETPGSSRAGKAVVSNPQKDHQSPVARQSAPRGTSEQVAGIPTSFSLIEGPTMAAWRCRRMSSRELRAWSERVS